MSFFFAKKCQRPKVSVCIPVKNTEKLLGRCLDSLASQGFDGLELVLINDQSEGRDEKGRGCKKIARSFHKSSKIPLVYIEHTQSVPLLETRRELVEHSHGDYILMVDSDDYLAENAVKTLYDSAQKTGADITCGKEKVYSLKEGLPQIKDRQFAFHKEGLLSGSEILESWIVKSESSAFLWAKLIKRELYLKAFSEIPYMDCSLSVDTPMYFFIAYHAKSYVGISDIVYYYLENEGITGFKKVESLEKWRRYCTTASIYSLLLTFEGDISEDVREGVRRYSRLFLRNSIIRMKNLVAPELQQDARKMLCEYWGEGFVEKVEKAIEEAQAASEAGEGK